jgi:AcrR family transcriptional regulator
LNTKNNQRYRNTKIKIKNALIQLLGSKELRRITIREICTIAEINHATFYVHYQDIYDLMEQTEQEMEEGIILLFQNAGINETNFLTSKCFTTIINYIGEHQKFYLAYFNGCGNTALRLSFSRLWTTIVLPYFQNLGISTEVEMKYHFEIFQSSIVRVMQCWIESGCKETPEELAFFLMRRLPINQENNS